MPKELSIQEQEITKSVNDLFSYASPEIIERSLLDMYDAYAESDNADCKMHRIQITNVFSSLILFVKQAKKAL